MSPRRYAVVVALVTLAGIVAGLYWLGERTRARMGARPAGRAPASLVELPREPDRVPSPREIEIHRNERDSLEYVFVPPGAFIMGCAPGDTDCSDDERPQHRVTLERGFWITRTEVTVGAFARFAASTGSAMPGAPDFNPGWSAPAHPVTNVTWKNAHGYCAWLGGRLPSEAEWEYAARGGRDGRQYPWGDDTLPQANLSGGNGEDRWIHTAPVSSFPPNGFGLYDMAGNVSEWVHDRWHASYVGAPSDGSAWGNPGVTAPGKSAGVLRGGSWSYGARQLRCSYRARWFWPGNKFDDYGFRCVIEEPGW